MPLDVTPQYYSQMIHAPTYLGNEATLYRLISSPNAQAHRTAPLGCESPPCSTKGTDEFDIVLVAMSRL
jgi:hypothetical protein